MTDLLEGLAGVDADEFLDAAAAVDVGIWAERKRGFQNAPFHWEWYGLLETESRQVIVAPREHAKSECVTINSTAHASIYNPGIQTRIFALTADLAGVLLERIIEAVEDVEPWMVDKSRTKNTKRVVFANGSQVTVAGAGKKVRGGHPDRIIGDDVLDEDNTLSYLQRKRMERWWLGTVSGMCHPGTTRTVKGREVRFPPTRVALVGTPFHQEDLLMSLRHNPIYSWRRYSAEFEALVPDTTAVEVT